MKNNFMIQVFLVFILGLLSFTYIKGLDGDIIVEEHENNYTLNYNLVLVDIFEYNGGSDKFNDYVFDLNTTYIFKVYYLYNGYKTYSSDLMFHVSNVKDYEVHLKFNFWDETLNVYLELESDRIELNNFKRNVTGLELWKVGVTIE